MPTTLSERLCALEVSAGKYAKKRKGALRDVTELRKEYLEYCATVGSEEAAAAEEEGEEEDSDSDRSSEEEGEEDQDSDNSSDWEEAVGATGPKEGEEEEEEEGMEVLQDGELGGYPSDSAVAAGDEEGEKEEGEDEGVEEGMSGGPQASQASDIWSEDEQE